jgi:hypothetical protein
VAPVGGEGGIRTLGTHESTTVFETAPIDRSGTSPSERDQGLSIERPRTKPVFGTQLAPEEPYALAPISAPAITWATAMSVFPKRWA